MKHTPLTPRGLIRRVKRHLISNKQEFAAITFPGLENCSSEEISRLDGAVINKIENGIVEFSGPLDLVYTANLCLRTVNRVLMRIAGFTARSYPELYNKLLRVKWERYVGFTHYVSFTTSSRTSRLHHTDRITLTALSALNHYMSRFGLKVEEDPSASIRFFIRLYQDSCTLSIDSSGELLYRRGYRLTTGRAPLRETVAAALLEKAAWFKYHTIADPCCGTGSIVLEALQMVCKISPGLNREFAFFSWPSFNSKKWENIKKKAFSDIIRPQGVRIIASDINREAVDAVRKNSSAFSASELLTIERADCLKFNEDDRYGNSGLIISNLPFGKRIEASAGPVEYFYYKLGRHLKNYCRGWNFAFLIADPNFERKAGLSCRTELRFINGGIRVRLVTGKV